MKAKNCENIQQISEITQENRRKTQNIDDISQENRLLEQEKQSLQIKLEKLHK